VQVLPLTSPAIGVSLAQALRYVAAWRERIVVVNFGGSVLDAIERGTLAGDLVLLLRDGGLPVRVHCGGREVTRPPVGMGAVRR